jgi:hypothetical protein
MQNTGQGEPSGLASSRVYWTTQTTNTSGRAARDKLAKHAGFIVYSHEL